MKTTEESIREILKEQFTGHPSNEYDFKFEDCIIFLAEKIDKLQKQLNENSMNLK